MQSETSCSFLYLMEISDAGAILLTTMKEGGMLIL